MNGLSKCAAAIFDQIASLDIIRRFTLVGGTALALQLNHRQSEDFDFMIWQTRKDEKLTVDWDKIVSAFDAIGKVENIDVPGFDQVTFSVQGVKFSFYASPRRSPLQKRIHVAENLYISDIESIAVMKMEVITRRAKFRDYYDLYCIFNELNDTEKIKEIFSRTLKYSEYRVSSKTLYAFLSNSERIGEEKNFKMLEPKHNVSAKEIEEYLKEQMIKMI